MPAKLKQLWCRKIVSRDLTINIVWLEGNFDAECFVGVFDGGQCEVRERLLGKVGHHSFWKTT